MIQATCSQCGLRIQVPSTVQGRQGICFACGSPMVVPQLSDQTEVTEVSYSHGDRIADRYIIDTQIGKGGMGVVYRAQDALIEEDVALKFMHPKTWKTQRGQMLFIKEAQIARRLRHENIVSVHDVGTTPEGLLYLSMELLKGTSLREYLRRLRAHRRLVDVRLAINIVLQTLAAMEYAHKMVVHRDLKPENIMLMPGEVVKVLDFGLAMDVDDEPTQSTNQPDGKKKRIVGTAVYASPEQHRHQKIDFRSDLYTVGVIFHELLTLRTPVDEPVNVMDVREDVAPSIIKIIDKARQHDKDHRWQSAREFRKAVSEAYKASYRKKEVKEFVTKNGKTFSTENMAYLDGGHFLMGNMEVREEAPEFETHIDPYYIDKYPVTVQEYEEFLKSTGHNPPKFWEDPEFNGPRQPVVGITFNDALAYAGWVGKKLPTEKQWEYAARGRDNRKYPWGNLDPDTTRTNYGDYLGMPSIVSMHDKGRTPDGIYDLGGNVYEWTLDGFVPYNPKNGGDNTKSKDPRRVVRGGSWHSDVFELRATNRKGLFPETRLTTVGFRCTLNEADMNGHQS
jgi:serine/threonine protein kinase